MSTIIAIPASGLEKIGVMVPYLNWAEQFGSPILIPPMEREDFAGLCKALNLIILPGGSDVNPARYKKKPSYYTQKSDNYLEYFDEVLLPIAIEIGVPIFGICRGHQTLNVHFGGMLTQNLPWHAYSTKSRVELVHIITPKLRNLTPDDKKKSIQVNSMHHQGFFIDQLGQGLIPIYFSEDKNVEAMRHNTLPICSVQWHPEEIWDGTSENFMKELLRR